MDEGYDLEAFDDMDAEEQELFFNKIGDAFKKAGSAIVDTTKKIAPHVDKGLSVAANVAGAVAPVASAIPVVGGAVGVAAQGIQTANAMKDQVKASTMQNLMSYIY